MRSLVCLVVPLLIAGSFAAPAFDDDSNEEVILEENDFDDELYGSLIGRIIGGATAPPGAFPYQVSLQINGKHFCGGSILNSEWILTAAQCLNRAGNSTITVVAGTNRLNRPGSERNSLQVIPHPEYDYGQNNIGLIKLAEPLVYSDLIKPIALPLMDTIAAKQPMVVSGWGKVTTDGGFPHHLQYIKTETVDHDSCRRMSTASKNDICTKINGGSGNCFADEGGPLVADGDGKWIVGVVSGNMPCGLGFVDIYTRVYCYRDWINQYIN